jgi:hypothetical protein
MRTHPKGIVVDENTVTSFQRYNTSESARRKSKECYPYFKLIEEKQEKFSDPEGGSNFNTCREALIGEVSKHILKGTIKTDKLCLSLYLENDLVPQIPIAMKILKLYEDVGKFNAHSEIFHFNLKEGTKTFEIKDNLFLLIASRRWMKSSYMLSLFLLLLRIGLRSDLTDGDVGSVEKFEKRLENTAGIGDIHHVVVSKYYWQKVIRNYHELFGKRKISKNWNPDDNKGFYDQGYGFKYEGISKLSDGTTKNKPLRDKLVKLN